MTVHVRQEPAIVVIEIDTLPDEGMWRLLTDQLPPDGDGSTAVVLDVSGLVLRPAEIRALGRLVDDLPCGEVWLACSRLGGRRLLRRLLLDQVPVVARPADVTAARLDSAAASA
ncbi:hypothetical protein [Iamia sp.]|uniref:hypothetical protein n=1 Tax=Iamia sp. TaxID=2722710 RepID=UPI002CAE0B36|nr:hypothetical protein [Iamia sp.]HXH57662.1 hypothetical protein [Iamia sp.]